VNPDIHASRRLDLAWLALVSFTLGGAFMGEFGADRFWVVAVVALVTFVKGRMVIVHFMELNRASPVIRRVVGLFGMLVPLLMLITWLWGPQLARVNWLGN